MKKTCALFAMLFFISLSITGCWDRKEINELAIIIAAAIDAAEDGGVIGTVQIATPSGGVSGGGGPSQGGAEKESYSTVSGHGKNIYEVLAHLEKRLPRKLFISHRKVQIIGEPLAKRGIKDILDYYSRDPRHRLRSFVVIARNNNGRDLLNTSVPFEKVPGTAIEELEHSDVGIAGNFMTLVTDMATEEAVTTLDVVELVPATINKEEKQGDSQDQKQEKMTFQLVGSAVIKQYKLAGYLDRTQTRGLLWMNDKVKRGLETAQTPVGSLGMEIIKADRKIRTEISGGKVKVHINLKANGPIHENETNLDLSQPDNVKQVEKYLKKAIEERVNNTIFEAQNVLKADIFGIGRELSRSHPKEWKRLKKDWSERFPEVEFFVNAKVTVTRTGLHGAPVHLQENELNKQETKQRNKNDDNKKNYYFVKYVLFLGLVIVMMSIYLFSKKVLYAIEHMFLILFFMYAYTTVLDLVAFLEFIKAPKQLMPYFSYRFGEFVVPMTIVLFVDCWYNLRSFGYKLLALIVCLGVLFGIEAIAVHYRFIKYIRSEWWMSLIWWCFWIAFTFLSQKWFRWFIKEARK